MIMVLIIIIVRQNESELIKMDYNQEEKPLHKKKKRLMKQRSQTDFNLHSVSSKNLPYVNPIGVLRCLDVITYLRIIIFDYLYKLKHTRRYLLNTIYIYR